MLEELLKALGVASVAEAMAAINRYNQMCDDVCALMTAPTTGEALTGLRQLQKFASNVEACAGAKGPEALAKMEAWKASAEQLRTTEASLTEIRQAQARTTATNLIEVAMRDKKLAPAMQAKAEEFFTEYGLKALETFLAAMPSIGIQEPTSIKQPTPPKPESDGEWTPDDASYAKAVGKTKEQVMAARKLWTESKGEIPNAHVDALNKQLVQPRRTAS